MLTDSGTGARGFAEISQARLGTAQAAEMLEYVWTPFADVDAENMSAMIRCNMAHTVMLFEQGILSRDEAVRILAALKDLESNPQSFTFDPAKGDLVLNVEANVIARAGAEIGGKMHLGRGRVDLISALMRLKMRKNLARLLPALLALRGTLLDRAGATADAVMAAYTHLQPAQITTFGHYLLAFYDVTARDLRRLLAAFQSVNSSPLGAAASSGTSWPLNRERVAELLGFSSVIENTKDAGHNYDWLAEVLATAAILMSNMARVAADLYIWCSNEFALVELDGAFAAGSSILPQKKNPYSLEMIKARSGEVTAAFSAVLEILKGDTGGTAFDIKLTGSRIADNAVNRVADMVMLLTPVLKTLRLNRERMLSSAGDGFTTAVGLADTLVRTGLSFRTAHLVVGTLVKTASERKLGYRDVSRSLLNEAARQVIGRDVDLDDAAIRASLDPQDLIRTGRGNGGPAPGEVKRMIASRAAGNADWERKINGVLESLGRADQKLSTAVEALS